MFWALKIWDSEAVKETVEESKLNCELCNGSWKSVSWNNKGCLWLKPLFYLKILILITDWIENKLLRSYWSSSVTQNTSVTIYFLSNQWSESKSSNKKVALEKKH